jgi:hypothetical protein
MKDADQRGNRILEKVKVKPAMYPAGAPESGTESDVDAG